MGAVRWSSQMIFTSVKYVPDGTLSFWPHQKLRCLDFSEVYSKVFKRWCIFCPNKPKWCDGGKCAVSWFGSFNCFSNIKEFCSLIYCLSNAQSILLTTGSCCMSWGLHIPAKDWFKRPSSSWSCQAPYCSFNCLKAERSKYTGLNFIILPTG